MYRECLLWLKTTEFGSRSSTMTGITRVKFLSFFSLLSAPLSIAFCSLDRLGKSRSTSPYRLRCDVDTLSSERRLLDKDQNIG